MLCWKGLVYFCQERFFGSWWSPGLNVRFSCIIQWPTGQRGRDGEHDKSLLQECHLSLGETLFWLKQWPESWLFTFPVFPATEVSLSFSPCFPVYIIYLICWRRNWKIDEVNWDCKSAIRIRSLVTFKISSLKSILLLLLLDNPFFFFFFF